MGGGGFGGRGDVECMDLRGISVACFLFYFFLFWIFRNEKVGQTECRLWSTLPPNPPSAITANCGCVADTFTPRQLSSASWFSVKSGGCSGEYREM